MRRGYDGSGSGRGWAQGSSVGGERPMRAAGEPTVNEGRRLVGPGALDVRNQCTGFLYGLGAGVWTQSVRRATTMARRIAQ